MPSHEEIENEKTPAIEKVKSKIHAPNSKGVEARRREREKAKAKEVNIIINI